MRIFVTCTRTTVIGLSFCICLKHILLLLFLLYYFCPQSISFWAGLMRLVYMVVALLLKVLWSGTQIWFDCMESVFFFFFPFLNDFYSLVIRLVAAAGKNSNRDMVLVFVVINYCWVASPKSPKRFWYLYIFICFCKYWSKCNCYQCWCLALINAEPKGQGYCF